VPVELQESLVDGVFGILAMAEEAEGRAEERPLVTRINLAKGAEVALLAAAEDALFLGLKRGRGARKRQPGSHG
jgi:hypothetical protein